MTENRPYQIVKYPEPVLLQETAAFDFNAPLIEPDVLVKNMLEAMHTHKGVGLSANQVGLPISMFVMRGEPNYACFNPRIVDSSDLVILAEGCLSLPGLFVKIKRPSKIRVRFQTQSGSTTTETFTGLTARIFQHEMMHLRGKYFFEGCGRLALEKAIRKGENAYKQDYSQLKLMRFVQ